MRLVFFAGARFEQRVWRDIGRPLAHVAAVGVDACQKFVLIDVCVGGVFERERESDRGARSSTARTARCWPAPPPPTRSQQLTCSPLRGEEEGLQGLILVLVHILGVYFHLLGRLGDRSLEHRTEPRGGANHKTSLDNIILHIDT